MTLLRVTALAASAQLGGTERVLLDFAARAFEHDIALRVLTPRGGPLIDILNQLGVPADVVSAPAAVLSGSQQPGRLLSSIPAALALPLWGRALRSHAYARDADVLYSVAFKAHLVTTFPLRKKVAWHLHEFPPQRTGEMWKWLARRVPHALIANSQAVAHAWEGKREAGSGKRKAESSPLPPSRFPLPAVVPNGVELDRFKPAPPTGWIRQSLGLPTSARLIGMPAVFAQWKGQELVLEAFRCIASEFPDAHLVFVGGSIYDTTAEREYGRQLSDSSARFTVNGIRRIHIVPFQSRVEAAYPEFDLTVHYSLRPEPFGRVILEAMACGVPVLAADEGGPVEILGADPTAPAGEYRAGTGGWLVKPRDVASLASALRNALSRSVEERRETGRAGRSRAEEHFSSRAFARGIARVLHGLERGKDEK